MLNLSAGNEGLCLSVVARDPVGMGCHEVTCRHVGLALQVEGTYNRLTMHCSDCTVHMILLSTVYVGDFMFGAAQCPSSW